MKLYGLLLAAMSAVFLALFGVVEALQIPLLTQPDDWLAGGWLLAALVGFSLLASDVLLPVPASLVMIAHGAVFGVALGSALSLLGGMASAALGFLLGRWGSPWLARFMSPEEHGRADQLLSRWGSLAVVASRPVPIVSESVSILAGTTSMSWSRFLVASLAGSLPASILYAVTGATAVSLDSVAIIFTLVLAIAGIFWWIGRRFPSSTAGCDVEPGAVVGS